MAMLRSSIVTGVVGVGLAAGYVLVLGWAMFATPFNTWGALLGVPMLIAANVPLLIAAARRENSAWFTRIFVAGFVLKLLGSGVRYWFAFVVYGGVADASGYAGYAEGHYLAWRNGAVVLDFDFSSGGKWGTAVLRWITTGVYVVTGPSLIAAFVVFALFAFWGCYLLYRAFAIALPDGNLRRYAALLFLLPSFLYWPSSVGKEAWLLLGVGATALGAAKLFDRQLSAIPFLAAGLACTALVRPHFAAMLLAGLVIGQVFRPLGRSLVSVIPKALGVAALIAAGVLVSNQTADFLGIDTVDFQGVSDAITKAGAQTEQGGSRFEPVPITSPLGVPTAFVSVLVRPFMWEAHNAQAMVSALEGILVSVFLVASWRRILVALSGLLRRPYLLFGLTYLAIFVYAFAGFGNFGILARERVLVMPFLLMLVALPRTAGVKASQPGREVVGAESS